MDGNISCNNLIYIIESKNIIFYNIFKNKKEIKWAIGDLNPGSQASTDTVNFSFICLTVGHL